MELSSGKKEKYEHRESSLVPSGTEVIDSLLKGGYERDVITTIYGPSGSGKTNLCLLALIAVSKQKKVIFIDTEGGFSVSRLNQLCGNSKDVMSRTFFLEPANFEEQKRDFEKLKELVEDNIGLIIVDTISMLYRAERGDEDIRDMNNSLGRQLNYLTEIARKKRIPVIITNQVYSDFEKRDSVKMVGGDMLKYTSKCLIELQNSDDRKKAILRKHRSLPEGREEFFEITEKGVFLSKEKQGFHLF
ncbi:MAG: DNA repair and recombination protein RadB [Candidatus Woesearchaeota archaeon]|nr:DNA repair and recombination protein RadB [Candidatus Woesearchaeota archaeon]